MTVNNSRNKNSSFNAGATGGKYRKRRPNTEVIAGAGDELVQKNREGLNPYWNYGFINSEAPNQVNPAGN